MSFPAAEHLPAPWRELSLPMFAPTTTFHQPWAEVAEEVIAAEGISLADLRIPGLRRPAFGEAPRPLIVAAGSFTISSPEPDEMGRPNRLKRTLRFELPRGAYATVVLRALGQ